MQFLTNYFCKFNVNFASIPFNVLQFRLFIYSNQFYSHYVAKHCKRLWRKYKYANHNGNDCWQRYVSPILWNIWFLKVQVVKRKGEITFGINIDVVIRKLHNPTVKMMCVYNRNWPNEMSVMRCLQVDIRNHWKTRHIHISSANIFFQRELTIYEP